MTNHQFALEQVTELSRVITDAVEGGLIRALTIYQQLAKTRLLKSYP